MMHYVLAIMFRAKYIYILGSLFSLSNGEYLSSNYGSNRFDLDFGLLNKYYVYNIAHNPRIPFDLSSSTINSAPLSSARHTIVLVHGLHGHYQNFFNIVLKDAILTHDSRNTETEFDIIVLDWEHVSTLNNAEERVPQVANALTNLLLELFSLDLVTPHRLHLVGFDNGAHLVGITGRQLNGKIARITGLDPSKLNWSKNPLRLSRNDAPYVEVIHTDVFSNDSLGIREALGHVDIYSNGGVYQPGCSINTCRHERAWELFAASLTHPGTLVANRCKTLYEVVNSHEGCKGTSLEVGGSELKKSEYGLHRVNTGAVYPYSV